MSEITRYALKHPYRDVIVPSKCGMMVLYSDHAAREATLQQQLSDQRAVIERLEGMYRTERAWRRDYHAPRPSWNPYSSETELQGRLRCLREVREYNERCNAETESAIQAAKGTR